MPMLSLPVRLVADVDNLAGERHGAIDNLEKFANDALNDYLGPRAGYSKGEPRQELLAHIFLVSVRCVREYDPLKANGLSFPTYTYRMIHLRITDHFRKLGGDNRYGPRPVQESIEERHDELAAVGGVSALDLLDDLDTTGLTPDGRKAISKFVRPMLEKYGKITPEAKDEGTAFFGWDRREMNLKLRRLKVDLFAAQQQQQRAAA